MNRVCVIDIAALSPRLLAHDTSLWINSLACPPRAMKPTFPAVQASVQASMTTGVGPGQHGVIGGGLYRRQCGELSFDERSNTLLMKKRFWHSRRFTMPKVAMVLWSNPLAGAADIVMGAMSYGPAGVSLAEHPVGLYGELVDSLGACDTSLLRGPRASWPCAGWLVSAAQEIWRRHKPDLQWVYLPGVDFEVVRWGVESAQAIEAMRVLDMQARRLADDVLADGGSVVVVSDGGYVDVSRVAFPNVALCQAGLLKVVPTDLGDMPDLQSSAAFAMVDHQVAHVYCKDNSAARAAGEVLRGMAGVDKVLDRQEVFESGLGMERAGEKVLLAAPDAWLSYRWWTDDSHAPRTAARWDVQGKLGFDPCEFFAGQGGAGGRIDANPGRVRASRGLVPASAADFGVFGASIDVGGEQCLDVTDVPHIVGKMLLGG